MNFSKLVRGKPALALLATTALGVSGIATVANGAPAGGGAQANTQGPDPVSATVTRQANFQDNTATSEVRICFDLAISTSNILAGGNIQLTGVQSAGANNPLIVTQAIREPADNKCVRATFPPQTDVSEYSTVEVETSAVEADDASLPDNTQGAVALDNSDVTPTPGFVAGPNLVSGEKLPQPGGAGEVVYTFDKFIDPGSFQNQFVGFYDADGRFRNDGTNPQFSNNTVRLTYAFPGAGAIGPEPNVADAVRYVSFADGIFLATQTDQGNVTRAVGGAIPGRPELVSVTKVRDGQYDFAYDQDVEPFGDPTLCQVVTTTQSFDGTGQTRRDDNDKILRITFADLVEGGPSQDANDELVAATDQIGCAAEEGFAGDGGANDFDQISATGNAPLQVKDHRPGFTSGPDLTGCKTDGALDEVTFTFDETIVNPVNDAGFLLITQLGSERIGTGQAVTLTDDEKSAIVRFGGNDIDQAVACSVDRNTVTDNTTTDDGATVDVNEENPIGTVRRDTQGTTSGGQTTQGQTTQGQTTQGQTTQGQTTTGTSTGTSTGATTTGGTTINNNNNTTGTTTGTTTGSTTTGRPAPTSVTSSLTPKSDFRGAVQIRTRGRVNLPSGATASRFCATNPRGRVSVQIKAGTRTISTRRVSLTATCTYSVRTTFTLRNRFGSAKRLKVTARFLGNNRLRPRSATAKFFRVRR